MEVPRRHPMLLGSNDPVHLTTEQLTAGLEEIRKSPTDNGTLEMIVICPEPEQREVLEECELSLARGAHGDKWANGFSKKLPDGSPHPDTQITLMNSRAADLICGSRERWVLAGDQLFVDLDLSDENLKAGDWLSIGTVVLEVTDEAHNGCHKFNRRFGADALAFVNSPEGRQMHLRGIYARVARDGRVRQGDVVRKAVREGP